MLKCYEWKLGSIPPLAGESWISTLPPGECSSCWARGTRHPSHRMPLTCSAEAASFARTTWMLEQGPRLLLPTGMPWTLWTVSLLADEMKYWNQSNLKRRQGLDTYSLVLWNTSVQIQFKWLKHLNSDFLRQVLYSKTAYRKGSSDSPNCREDCHNCKPQMKWDSSQQPRLGASLCERQGLS